ncbi:MAG: Outer membrane lipoprotein SlyB [Paracidovorax wautersii]|uniref:Outer membrane lipoprotein SlyB n=1 Tax=Paracidovorax wautersii TaxID=1177982 RepID=A0A7V8FMW4_9BURK|nr:MAG: Outer membrane lipoprotein SlyB [Paracidovorax wautersii]
MPTTLTSPLRPSTWLVAGLAAVTLTLAGCASSLTGDTYSRSDARQVQSVQTGLITELRPVQIEGTKTPIGTIGGAAIGGVAGSAVGGGRGSAVAAIIGAIGGGLLGSATEEGLTRTQGVEITVLDSYGNTRAYVQQVSQGEVFRVGDRVRILTVNGNSRVAH